MRGLLGFMRVLIKSRIYEKLYIDEGFYAGIDEKPNTWKVICSCKENPPGSMTIRIPYSVQSPGYLAPL